MLLPKEENPWGGAFVKKETDLTNEADAGRVVDSTKARFWKIKNPAKKHVYSGAALPNALHLLHPDHNPDAWSNAADVFHGV